MELVKARRQVAMQQQRVKAVMKPPMKKAWPSCLHVSSVSTTEAARKNQRSNPHGFCDMRVFLTLMEA